MATFNDHKRKWQDFSKVCGRRLDGMCIPGDRNKGISSCEYGTCSRLWATMPERLNKFKEIAWKEDIQNTCEHSYLEAEFSIMSRRCNHDNNTGSTCTSDNCPRIGEITEASLEEYAYEIDSAENRWRLMREVCKERKDSACKVKMYRPADDVICRREDCPKNLDGSVKVKDEPNVIKIATWW